MSPRPSLSRQLLDRIILLRESNLEKKMENLIQVIKHLQDQVEFLQDIISEDHIVFKTGSASIVMTSDGNIDIKGNNIAIRGSGRVQIKGAKIEQN
jgi:uncharacterized protein (DUF2345 family)